MGRGSDPNFSNDTAGTFHHIWIPGCFDTATWHADVLSKIVGPRNAVSKKNCAAMTESLQI